MNTEVIIGAFPMHVIRNELQPSSCVSVNNANFEKLGEGTLEPEKTHSQRFLQVSIFSSDRFIRDFLKGILVFQGYACVNVTDFPDKALDVSLQQEQVVFLDGGYLVGSESERVRSQIQQFTQAGGQVVIMAIRPGDDALTAIQNTGGCQIMWKPLDYRQVGQVMANIR